MSLGIGRFEIGLLTPCFPNPCEDIHRTGARTTAVGLVPIDTGDATGVSGIHRKRVAIEDQGPAEVFGNFRCFYIRLKDAIHGAGKSRLDNDAIGRTARLPVVDGETEDI